MSAMPLRVLLVEDNPGDARLVHEFLSGIPELELHHVDLLQAGLDHLKTHEVDVILLDLGLPDSQGLDTVLSVVAEASGKPVIVLTGLDDETTGVAAVRAGAEDYLPKGELAGPILPRAIRYAIERSEHQSQLRHLNKLLQAIRGVNQLIVRERDRGRLIKGCCEELTRPGGFEFAVVCLVDKADRVIMLESCSANGFQGILSAAAMESLSPGCLQVIRHEGVLTGKDIESFCISCPLAEFGIGWMKMVTRLECRGQIYGFLCVLNSDKVRITSDEKALFQELGDDLAFALYSIEEQKRRERAEAIIAARLDLLEFGAWHTLNEVLIKTLDVVENLTQSRISFYHFMEDDQQTVSLQAWSTRTTQEFCQVPGSGRHYPLDNAGVWAECVGKGQPVIHDDYPSLSQKKGFPPGHAEVIREMVIPIYRSEKIVAILGVGNKPTEYTEEDIRTGTLLGDVAWEIISRKRIETGLQDSEKRYRSLFESEMDGIVILDADTGKIIDANPSISKLLGYSTDEFIEKHLWDMGPFEAVAASSKAFEILKEKGFFHFNDLTLKAADGRSVNVEFIGNGFNVDKKRVIQCNIRDITERKQVEAERERLLSAIEQAGEMIVITDPEGIIQYANPSFARTTGYKILESIGKNIKILKSGKQDRAFYENLWTTVISGKTWKGRMINKRKDGTFFAEDATISPVFDTTGQITNYVAVKHDISEHLELESQFRQAQKMESVGRLAGGVAHDYNNMLTVIIGNSELALTMTQEDDPLHEFLQEIFNAGKRSAEITRQLLAFASKQTIDPQVLDLNETVDGMLKMLRRLIGEDICLAWLPETNLWPVKMDPSQIDQILANLCVNARDAISGVGHITIETGMITLDQEKNDEQPGDPCGDFVFLAVMDDGCGMDSKTLENIFEPFFTTKSVGKGTGLGLSTVYGIVKQNHGFINVSSEPGKGTTIKIHLPRDQADADRIKVSRDHEIQKGCGETILIVEDEIPVLHLIKSMLQRTGYSVLAAATPNEALHLVEKHRGEIQLLMTDLIMPEINGRDLAQRLQARFTDLKVLYMSGYTADVLAHQCVMDKKIQFIPKPFSMMDLAQKVRQVLMSNT